MKPLLPVCALALAACATAPSVDAPRKPAYLDAVTQGVPNEAAITHRYFTPGLEDGFVPQGLTFADGHVLVAAYRSADPKVNTGPCRVCRIDAATGAPKGAFDIRYGLGATTSMCWCVFDWKATRVKVAPAPASK